MNKENWEYKSWNYEEWDVNKLYEDLNKLLTRLGAKQKVVLTSDYLELYDSKFNFNSVNRMGDILYAMLLVAKLWRDSVK